MFFDKSYFEGEEREGFYIAPMMKRAWAAQLEVLREIDLVCERHGIEYFAEWGTLLGAIRHQGYIPWDDDLDIGMKRVDYVKFLRVAEKELPETFQILSVRSDNTWKEPIARVVNTDKIPLTDKLLEQFHGFPYLAGIDIAPIDYLPQNKEEEDILIALYQATFGLAQKWEEEDMSLEEKLNDLKEVEEICNVKFDKNKSYQQQLFVLGDQVASMYWDAKAEAKEVALIYNLAKRPGYKASVECYSSTIRVPFENTTIPIPVGYEELLKMYYGENYMVPVRFAAGHDYPFYEKQQKELFEAYEKMGIEIPKYLTE